jgi:hypothetical protein
VPTIWSDTFGTSGTLTSPELTGCGDLVTVQWLPPCNGDVVVSIVPDAPAGPPSTTTLTTCGTVATLPAPGNATAGVLFHVQITWTSAQGTVAIG